MSRVLGMICAVALFGALSQRAVAQAANPATVSAELNRTAVQGGRDAVVAVVLDIKKGFHAQSHTPLDKSLIALTVAATATDGVTFGEVVYPAGKEETYPGLGVLNVYDGRTIFYVPVKVAAEAKEGPLKIGGTIRYQICDDKSCFAPKTTQWSVETKVVGSGQATGANAEELFKDYNPGGATTRPQGSTQPTTATVTPSNKSGGAPPVVVEDEQLWGTMWALGVAFLAGILFNVVPCVLPVLPIKVLGFAEVAQHDRGKTVTLATVFGLGIVTVFAVLAVLILVFQTITWGQQYSNPFFAWGMVLVLLLLSLWLFGILHVNLPGRVYEFQPRHDTYVGNYMMGIMTAVLSTPCTGPLFPPLMKWASSQPTALGVSAMMTVGVGMAFPYVVLSAFPEAARRFPRVGPWADLFKQMLGFMLLAFTVFFAAGRFTTPAGQWWAAVPVAAMAAFYLMARTVQLSKEARPVAISTVLSVGIVTASVLVACRFSGVFDPKPTGAAQGAGVNWTAYSDDVVDAARKAGKVVLVKFTANWCLNCQYVEATVYHDAQAIDALRKYDVVTVKADLTQDDAPGWTRLRELTSTGGIPLTAIYAPGYEKPVQISSVYTTQTLVKTLEQLAQVKTAGAHE
jgi:thiol:disulfide interchange protein